MAAISHETRANYFAVMGKIIGGIGPKQWLRQS